MLSIYCYVCLIEIGFEYIVLWLKFFVDYSFWCGSMVFVEVLVMIFDVCVGFW